jgi:hypothetical protein
MCGSNKNCGCQKNKECDGKKDCEGDCCKQYKSNLCECSKQNKHSLKQCRETMEKEVQNAYCLYKQCSRNASHCEKKKCKEVFDNALKLIENKYKACQCASENQHETCVNLSKLQSEKCLNDCTPYYIWRMECCE